MRERDIIKICYLFYNEGLSQVEIGAKMEMSRWKIGRIIKDARERGLVTITLNRPQIDLTETEIKIAKKFGIKQTIVVRINDFSGESSLDQIGAAGDLPGRSHRIVAGRVHEDEALLGDGLGVAQYLHKVGGAGLRHRAER